ncbi:carboxypeptidase regulatory-like domain-containing protein [Labilibaculum sp. DW002]|uniref:Carboxypeptidase regulatory-like domain-containing protein n=1 Tax=Paralabilibaculum antarcticum TaxID=2912572 RepID=A0ABT5VP29_9BACT|nr:MULTISPECIES: carboxypeptidase regulatory-like domain-containing protein [unclassified Labilibaculum]MBI9057453.1 TonB-dependent receptor [Labilibaculum sp.]MDE5417189.1 carboxypeptidase regulatory-like domain-containing protein [Labilibaculum sp. DW002]
MKNVKLLFLILAMASFLPNALSQGVTTSSMRGKIVDGNNAPVFAATVVATHTPTGTQYGTITQDDGRFDMRNMKIGGPYTVTVTFIGYKETKQENIHLQLNKSSEVNLVLNEDNVQIDEITIVYDKNDVMSKDRTGAQTNVDRERIAALPTISRSQSDMTRLTPESDGNSFGGRNNLYNNFSLDGSIFNNSFGLDVSTPGGQADAQPVSLDAIDQIQVSLAPFDVREGGFTGAGVNAVTKSGTNEFKGATYYYFRNENMIGDKVGGLKVENFDFSTKQYGVSVGGPIIKNKLFFFVNYEQERRDQLAHGFVADDGTNTGNSNTTSVSEADVKAVQSHLRSQWGYEPGAYQGYNHETSNDKFLIKLNANLSRNHNVVLRYNMLDAWKDILPHPEAVGGRGPTSFRLPFENSSYRIFNKINSFVGELHSRFSSKISNKLLVGYTTFRDKRDPKSAQFPVVDILDGNGNVAITAGSEMFSTSNVLNQDVFQISDNMTYYSDRHAITLGFNYERFKFENSFNLFYYPWVTAFGTQNFLNNDFAYFVGNPTNDLNQDVIDANKNAYAWSDVDVAQIAFYAQDEFQVNDDLKLTLGLRVDLPKYYNNIPQDEATDRGKNFDGWVNEKGNSIRLDPATWPDSKLMWSPRFGFNYDVKGDNTMQLRGGSGIFTGRIPFVWLGNQSTNARIDAGYEFQLNSTADDFKYPQVWKNNLAMDVKFGDGWLATVEGIYSKDVNAVVHRNYNMLPPSGNLTGTGDTRSRFAGFNEVNIYSASAGSESFLDAGAIVLDNTKKGYQFTATAKLAKRWNSGLTTDIAYTYLSAKDLTSIPAEIAADAFQRNPVVGNPNSPAYSWSRYGLEHRVIASAMYKVSYGKFASSFAMFYEAGKGNRYSYTYTGDLNGDAIANNDLIYIPKNSSDINFGTVNNSGDGVVAVNSAEQWAALDAFISQDDYMKDRRGKYAERNGALLPWFGQLDFRFMQDYNFQVGGKKNTLQFSIDVLNLGNMISSNWGVRQFATTTNPISVNGVDNSGTPWLQFDPNLEESYIDDVSVNSKWQLQVGLRYIFN